MTHARPVAVVTGARQGLGRATSVALAAKGFDLVLIDLADCDETAAAVAAAGGQARQFVGDISDLGQHGALARDSHAAFGRIDCLVNNAGIAARPLTDILDLGSEAFDRGLSVNLRGTFFLTQAFARVMRDNPSDGYRSIVFVTSIAASHVSWDRSPYCVAKAGLSMAAGLYAVRLAEFGIHVHEVRPGFIQTDMTASAATGKIDAYIETGRVPMQRWGRPEDIGTSIATIAAGGLPYMSGQAIHLDGGFHLPQA